MSQFARALRQHELLDRKCPFRYTQAGFKITRQSSSMETLPADQTWGIITILVSTALGLTIALILIAILNSGRLKKEARAPVLFIGFSAYLLWLFTLGDPKSSVSLESLYRKAMVRHVSQR